MYFSALLDPIYLCLNGLNKSSRASVHACAITQLLLSTAPGSLIGQEPRTSGFPAKVIHSVHLWGRGRPSTGAAVRYIPSKSCSIMHCGVRNIHTYTQTDMPIPLSIIDLLAVFADIYIYIDTYIHTHK